MLSATEAAGEGDGGRGEEETRSERVAAQRQVAQLLRVAGKAFTVGCGLQLGANVLSGIANKKLFKRCALCSEWEWNFYFSCARKCMKEEVADVFCNNDFGL